jgi:hypothetical protein
MEKQAKHCIDCDKIIREHNKSGYCSFDYHKRLIKGELSKKEKDTLDFLD